MKQGDRLMLVVALMLLVLSGIGAYQYGRDEAHVPEPMLSAIQNEKIESVEVPTRTALEPIEEAIPIRVSERGTPVGSEEPEDPATLRAKKIEAFGKQLGENERARIKRAGETIEIYFDCCEREKEIDRLRKRLRAYVLGQQSEEDLYQYGIVPNLQQPRLLFSEVVSDVHEILAKFRKDLHELYQKAWQERKPADPPPELRESFVERLKYGEAQFAAWQEVDRQLWTIDPERDLERLLLYPKNGRTFLAIEDFR